MSSLLSLRKHWRIAGAGVLFTLLAILIIVSEVDFSQFGPAWADARYIFVLPCAAFLLLGLVTRALRWRVLLSGGLPLLRSFSIMNVAYLINGLLPLRIGEVARAYLAARAEPPVPWMTSASTIIVERLLDLLAVVVMMALALAAGPVPEQLRLAGALAAPAALGGFLVLVALARRRDLARGILSALVGRVSMLQRVDLLGWLDHFLDGLQPLVRPRALLQALLWTVLSWGFSVLAGYILMFAFYDRGNWAATALYIAWAAFAIALPAVPANIGTYEASILLALGAMGYDVTSGTALAFALLVHGVNVAVHTITGIAGIIQEGISFGQLTQGVRQLQQHNAEV